MKPFLLGVSGGSCSGKTTLCNILHSQFSKYITVIKQDWYYKGGDENTNFDAPKSIDFDYMKKQLLDLIKGKDIEAPIYDFATHSRLKKTRTVKSNIIIVIEGILIFYEKNLCNLFDLRIFVDADMDTRFMRRLNRDVEERGRSKDEVKMRWLRDVKPSHQKYIYPTRHYSQIRINNDREDAFHKSNQSTQIEIISVYINHKINNK